MKIAIVSRGVPNKHYPLNGIFEFDQAKALARKGHEVAFIAIDFRNLSYKRKYGLFKYDSDGVKVFELSLPLGLYRRALPLLKRLLLIPFRAMMKSFGKPDVVHAHFYSIAAIATILKKKYGIPFVVTEHSSKLNKAWTSISPIDQRLARTAYQACDQLICVSPTLQQHIKSNFGKESIVIHNMVDNGCFNYTPHQKEPIPFTYVSVGNLIPLKRFNRLIDAFAPIHDGAKLIIIGDGPEKEALQAQVAKLGLTESISLLGQLERERINEIFQQCHVFVLASSSETFGVACIEALYAGLPVIVTRCGGPESFMNDNYGLLVPVDNTMALTEAMTAARTEYQRFDSKLISSSCMNQFSPEIIAENIIGIYSKMITFADETKFK